MSLPPRLSTKPKFPFFETEKGDVCIRAGGELAEFVVMNFARRI